MLGIPEILFIKKQSYENWKQGHVSRVAVQITAEVKSHGIEKQREKDAEIIYSNWGEC